MATALDKVLHTAKTHVTGDRDGNGRSDDGKIEVRLSDATRNNIDVQLNVV